MPKLYHPTQCAERLLIKIAKAINRTLQDQSACLGISEYILHEILELGSCNPTPILPTWGVPSWWILCP